MKTKLLLIASLFVLSGCHHADPLITPSDESLKTFHSEIEHLNIPKGQRPDLRSCVHVSEKEPCARITHYFGSAYQDGSPNVPTSITIYAYEIEHNDGHKDYKLHLSCIDCAKDFPLKITIYKKTYTVPYEPFFYKTDNGFSEHREWEATNEQAEEFVKTLKPTNNLKIAFVDGISKKHKLLSASGYIMDTGDN